MFLSPDKKYSILTPVHLQHAKSNNAKKPVPAPFNHLIGSIPKNPITEFITAPSNSLNANLNIVPATTTDVNAGK